jgi:dUTP pyrophosphatase
MTEYALTPTKESPKAAGFDLRSAYDVIVPAKGKELIETDLQIQLPEGCYGRIASRSGLALHHRIDVGAGVRDEDYRGNVGVIFLNHSEIPFVIFRGDRIAQFICQKMYYREAEEVNKLEDTSPGTGGFGSTGRN